jgi:hypothetical protein
LLRFFLALTSAIGWLTLRALAQPSTIPASEYQARRAALARTVGTDAVFVAFSFEPARRTGDVDWPFRQEDNLLYLTGMNTPDTTLVMLPGEPDHRELIFSTDRDPASERWTGRILSPEEVTKATGVREVLSARRVDAFIDAVLQGTPFGPGVRRPSGYYMPPLAPAFLSAFRSGRAEVWLVLRDRGSRSTPTRVQQLAAQLPRRYPVVTRRPRWPRCARSRATPSSR